MHCLKEALSSVAFWTHIQSRGPGVSLSPASAAAAAASAAAAAGCFSLSVPDASDGLDLGSLAVGAPVPPVLVVSTVFLTLHDVLLASVARVLIAHEAVQRQRQQEVK